MSSINAELHFWMNLVQRTTGEIVSASFSQSDDTLLLTFGDYTSQFDSCDHAIDYLRGVRDAADVYSDW